MSLKPYGHIQVGEALIEYRHVGRAPGDAPTLVLLHEGLGCVSLWKDFPERLSEATGHGVFVYSRTGYGKSSPCTLPRPLTYMHTEGQEVLPALLDVIGFRDGILVGHSDGASIAAIHAGSHTDLRVRGIVLIAPHFFTEEVGLEVIHQSRIAFHEDDLRDRLIRHHGQNVDCAFRGWNDAWLDPGFRDWNLEEFLPRIAVPVLAMQGRDDGYGTFAQIRAVENQCAGPVTVCALDDCGHSPHRDQPDAACKAMAKFIETVIPGPA